MKVNEKLSATLTDKYVRDLPPDTERYIRRDDRQPGFFVMVGEKTKTYFVQFDYRDALGKRKTRRAKLGRADQITAQEARAKAAAMIAAKERPPEKAADVTLGQAWEEYEQYLRLHERSPLTIRGGSDAVNRLLADWLDVPLRVLGENPRMVEARYMKLVEDKGVASGKNVMASLRAVYNKAAKSDPELRGLGNPVNFPLKSPKPRNDKALSPERLPAWYEQLRSLPSPIRQEYHLFMLLSGCRKTALAEARWEHVDIKHRSLHIPKPKGGTARAYDIPLSREMLRCLWRARRVGRILSPDSPWLFPSAESASGHIEVAQEKKGLATGHALRYTYRSLAHAAGANPYDADMLMNHKVPGMAGTYLSPTAAWRRLLEVQETISRFIWAAMAPDV